MRAIVTIGSNFPDAAREELEAQAEGGSHITLSGFVAMLQDSEDFTVIELELVDE